jgi:Tol biopolymer transport system component
VVLAVLTVATAPGTAWAKPVTHRVSVSNGGAQANRGSGDPASGGIAISGSGRYVAFVSDASNLVAGDTNGASDVFVHDRKTSTTERVSVASSGAQGNDSSFSGIAITRNGRYVAFMSVASNLVASDPDGHFDDVFLRDRDAGTTVRIPNTDFVFEVALSARARIIAYQGGGHQSFSIYNRSTGRTTRPNVDGLGIDGTDLAGISADGRFVLFTGGTLTHGGVVGLADRHTRRVRVISRSRSGGFPNAHSFADAISADGLHQMFTSDATDVVAGDTNGKADVFVHSSITGRTRRISVGRLGQANGASSGMALSAHGRAKLFISRATNLAAKDTNNTQPDLFLRVGSRMRRVGVGPGGVQPSRGIVTAALSDTAAWTAFASRAANLVPHDTNGFLDVFLRGPLP